MENNDKKPKSDNSQGKEIIGTIIFTGAIIILMWAASFWL